MKKILTILTAIILTNCGGGGGGSEPAPVPTPAPAPSTVSFSADVEEIYIHNTATLTWSSANATSCTASGDWEGSKELTGTEELVLKEAKEYTFGMRCNSSTSSAEQSVNIVAISPYVYDERWSERETHLNTLQEHFKNPVGFNLEKIWFNTLSIPNKKFSTKREDYFIEDENFRGTVGYDTWLNFNEKLYFFSCNWHSSLASEGGLKVFILDNGNVEDFIYKEVEGCTHPFNLKNSDGTYTSVFLGVDEGKLGRVDGEPTSPSYIFKPEDNSFIDMNLRLGAHGPSVFDYEQDGDQDIITNDYGTSVTDGFVSGCPPELILRNDGNEIFKPVEIYLPGQPQSGACIGTQSASAFYDEDSNLNVVYTDFDIKDLQDNEWDINLERNIIVTRNPNTFEVIDVVELPQPYNEVNFTDLEFYGPGAAGRWGLSHDPRSTVIDLDYDGDMDIIVSNQSYWREKNAFPQILINHDGEYVDETDERLFNWNIKVGNFHRWNFVDVNNDGYLDISTSDGCDRFFTDIDGNVLDVPAYLGCERRVAINDGDGHFVEIIGPSQIYQITSTQGEVEEHKVGIVRAIFGMHENKNLFWVYLDGKDWRNGYTPDGEAEIFTVSLEGTLSTGPNGIDPAIVGEPGYNEFYYLLHNESAREAVMSGEYENGLEHYIAVGKEAGLLPNAKSTSAVVVESYNSNPQHTIN